MTYQEAHAALLKVADKQKRATLQRFFKTGKGEYGEGDKFIGVMVPSIRKLSKQFNQLSLNDIQKLLCSPYNEERLLGLFILKIQFENGLKEIKEIIYNFYLKNMYYINNWNLVDGSAPYIMGPYLENRSREILYKFVKSNNIWKRRIAILSTFHFIRGHDFTDTLKIIKILLKDKHDLIHKASGWMLREIGKRDAKVLETFLADRYQKMPRTMLRYAIERFPKKKRMAYLTGQNTNKNSH
ncbi:MAG: DNA alkylation repair protein [Nitrospiria bacterium]